MTQQIYQTIHESLPSRLNESAHTVRQYASMQPATPLANIPLQTEEHKRRGRKKGFHHSEATKAAMRRARLGVHPSKETIAKIAKGKLGYRHSEISKEKMGDTRRYNFIRKRIDLARHGKATPPDLFAISHKTQHELDSMTSFARNLYRTVNAAIVRLFAHPHDPMFEQQTYAQLIDHIKELYNDRLA